jgi:membrane protease YdiL (CAAX protease family)
MLKKLKLNKFTAASFTYFILIIGFILIRLASYFQAFNFLGAYGGYVLDLVLQVGLMLLMPLFFYSFLIKQKPRETAKTFGFKKINTNAIAISIILGAIVFVLNIAVSAFFAYFLALLGYEKSTVVSAPETYTILTLITNLIFTAILPSICEEVMHRGMLVDGFSKLGYKKAIIYSAVLFGLTHLNIDQFFYATVIGVLLGFITISTGNIFPAIIIHFMNNAINVVINYAVNTSVAFKNAYNAFWNNLFGGGFLVSMFSIFVFITLLLLLMSYLLYRLFKETTINELETIAQEQAKKHMRAELMGDLIEPQSQPQTNGIPFLVSKQGKSFQIFVNSTTLRHPIKQTFFPTLRQKTFFIASWATAIFVTVATLIWGFL